MESIVEDYWRNFEWFVTRIKSIIWSVFTVKVEVGVNSVLGVAIPN
jgi:hypothetical protein